MLRVFMRGRLSPNFGLSGLCVGVCLAKLALSACASGARIVQSVKARDDQCGTARSIEPVAICADLLALRIERRIVALKRERRAVDRRQRCPELV